MPAQDEMPKTKVQTKRTSGLPPVGTYRFRVIECKEREGAKGPYWGFTCSIQNDQYFSDTHVYVNVSLSPQARWKMDEWLDAFQVPEEIEIDGNYFLGQFFRGSLVHNEFNGTNPNTGAPQVRRNAQIDAFFPDGQPDRKAVSIPQASSANMGHKGEGPSATEEGLIPEMNGPSEAVETNPPAVGGIARPNF